MINVSLLFFVSLLSVISFPPPLSLIFYHETPGKSTKLLQPQNFKKNRPSGAKAPEGKCRYRGIIQNTKSRLQIYKSGAETNIKINVGTGAIQVERENARRSGIAPIRAAAQRQLRLAPADLLRRVWRRSPFGYLRRSRRFYFLPGQSGMEMNPFIPLC